MFNTDSLSLRQTTPQVRQRGFWAPSYRLAVLQPARGWTDALLKSTCVRRACTVQGLVTCCLSLSRSLPACPIICRGTPAMDWSLGGEGWNLGEVRGQTREGGAALHTQVLEHLALPPAHAHLPTPATLKNRATAQNRETCQQPPLSTSRRRPTAA